MLIAHIVKFWIYFCCTDTGRICTVTDLQKTIVQNPWCTTMYGSVVLAVFSHTQSGLLGINFIFSSFFIKHSFIHPCIFQLFLSSSPVRSSSLESFYSCFHSSSLPSFHSSFHPLLHLFI